MVQHSKAALVVKAFSQILLVPQFKGQEVVELVRKAQQELEALLVVELVVQLVNKEVPAHLLLVVVAGAAEMFKTEE